MAGLKEHGIKFLNATIDVALNDYSGEFPLYCEKLANGNLDLCVGSWTEAKVGKDGNIPADFTREAIPPTASEGGVVSRCTLTIRNPRSPDAKKFASENGVDFDAKRPDVSKLTAKADAELTADERDLLIGEIEFAKEVNLLLTAGCIVGIHNVPISEDEVSYLECTPANCIQLLKDLPFAIRDIKEGIADRKKFVSRS